MLPCRVCRRWQRRSGREPPASASAAAGRCRTTVQLPCREAPASAAAGRCPSAVQLSGSVRRRTQRRSKAPEPGAADAATGSCRSAVRFVRQRALRHATDRAGCAAGAVPLTCICARPGSWVGTRGTGRARTREVAVRGGAGGFVGHGVVGWRVRQGCGGGGGGGVTCVGRAGYGQGEEGVEVDGRGGRGGAWGGEVRWRDGGGGVG